MTKPIACYDCGSNAINSSTTAGFDSAAGDAIRVEQHCTCATCGASCSRTAVLLPGDSMNATPFRTPDGRRVDEHGNAH